MELGKGFSFVGSQQRLTLDGDHFYVDLVFYNRLLRCFVLIDLKVGKLTHQDIGQMQLYVNYYTREVREEWEEPAIGILLCADKNEAVVRYTLPEQQSQVFASRYRLQLPSEEGLADELRREREALELRRALEGGGAGGDRTWRLAARLPVSAARGVPRATSPPAMRAGRRNWRLRAERASEPRSISRRPTPQRQKGEQGAATCSLRHSFA